MVTDFPSSRGSLAQAAGEPRESHRDFSNQGINWTIARDTCISGPSRCAVLIIEIMTVARARFGRTESSGVRKGCEAMSGKDDVRIERGSGNVFADLGRPDAEAHLDRARRCRCLVRRFR